MNNLSDLLFLLDLKTVEPPQENKTDMMFKVKAIKTLNVVPNADLTNCTNTVYENN